MRNISFTNRVTIGFALAAFLLSLNVFAIYKSFKQFDSQRHQIEYTQDVINHLQGIVSEMTEVQSSQRGYVITGQEDYLAPYRLAIPKIEGNFTDLHLLLENNTAQLSRLNAIRIEVDSRIATGEKIISTYQKEGAEKAFSLVRSGIGKRDMDKIHALSSEMIGEQQSILSIYQSDVKRTSALTLRISGIGLFFFVIVFSTVFFLIYRETSRREGTEISLKNALNEMHKATEDERKISTMIDYLQSAHNVTEAYNIIARMMPDILPGTNGTLSIYNDSRNFLEPVLSWGDTPPNMQEFLPDDCWALRRGQAHFISPASSEPPCAHVGTVTGTNNMICFPMQAQGETLGLFYAQADAQGFLDEARQNIVRRMAEQISLALSSLQLQNTLKIQSIRDPLTGLFNRRYLEESMDREFSRAQRNNQNVSVLVLDIDHFKKYNDTMGHDAGDALLTKFAKVLQDNSRKEDIVCRYGGEEFIIVLPTTSADMAVKLANKICEATRKMVISHDNNKNAINMVTVSIGVATYPAHATTPQDLITQADAALYQAKHGGRNQVKLVEDTAPINA